MKIRRNLLKAYLKNLKNNNKGFSLVELIVVIAIMIVLISLLAPNVIGYIEKANNVADVANAKEMTNTLMYNLAVDQTIDVSNIWYTKYGNKQRDQDHAYVYVDRDEIRVSSMAIAKILEDAGIIENAGIYETRSGVEQAFKYTKKQTRFVCNSREKWDRYEIHIYRRNNNLFVDYSASRKGAQRDVDATNAFANMIGGRANTIDLFPSGND